MLSSCFHLRDASTKKTQPSQNILQKTKRKKKKKTRKNNVVFALRTQISNTRDRTSYTFQLKRKQKVISLPEVTHKTLIWEIQTQASTLVQEIQSFTHT